jgi:hypothetical protein
MFARASYDLLLLFTPILSPEKAMYDLRAHVITRSSDRQFVLKFLQVEVQKSDAVCSHSSAARRLHRFLQLQQFGEETVKHRAMLEAMGKIGEMMIAVLHRSFHLCQ